MPLLTFENPAPAEVELPLMETAAAFAPREIVDPAIATLKLPVPLIDEVAGALIVIVAAEPAAPVAWDRDIGPEPTRTTLPVDTVPVAPAVFPAVETPKLTPPPPPPPAPLMTYEPFDTPTETLPAPASVKLPIEFVPLVPRVVLDAANIDCDMPVEAGAEMIKEFEDQPPETMPANETFRLFKGYALELLCPVVLPATNTSPEAPEFEAPEMNIDAPDCPIWIFPCPTREIERASYVDELLCPKVCDCA